jgi:hypothetical protein
MEYFGMQTSPLNITLSLVDDQLARFTFEDEHSKITGNVSLKLEGGGHDARNKEDRLKMARFRINALSAALSQACARGGW